MSLEFTICLHFIVMSKNRKICIIFSWYFSIFHKINLKNQESESWVPPNECSL